MHDKATKRTRRMLLVCWLIMVVLAATSLWFATRHGSKHAELEISENFTSHLIGKGEERLVIRLPTFGPNIRVGMTNYAFNEMDGVSTELRESLLNSPDLLVIILVGPGATDAVVQKLVQVVVETGAVHVVVNRDPIEFP